MQLIYLEWCDAAYHESEWMEKDAAIDWANNEDWVIRQSSFLVRETKEYVLLASRINNHHVNGLMKIPKTWIRKRINLKINGNQNQGDRRTFHSNMCCTK